MEKEGTFMEIVYWVILFVWIASIKILKKDSEITLKIAFILFILAAILTIVNLRNIAEPIMRVSFIGWMIGIFHALIEYIKQSKTTR